MDMQSTIARINELYRKQKTTGLTDAEKEEQAKLRGIYLDAIRASLRGQLERIQFVDRDKPES